MKISMLMENTPFSGGFLSEHGLSIHIETEQHRILFDMGQSDGFIANAEKMGIDLAAVDVAVLSHGHYDHGTISVNVSIQHLFADLLHY